MTSLGQDRVQVLVEEPYRRYLRQGGLRRAARQALRVGGAVGPVALGVVITKDETMRGLNARYRGHDEPTDVLSFGFRDGQGPDPFPRPKGPHLLGEVVISYSQALAQAEEQGHSVEQELSHLVIHGVLHLLGFDHERPEEAAGMQLREAEALEGLGYTPGARR